MARPRMNPNETIRGEILELLKTYSVDNRCIPNMHAFYHQVYSKQSTVKFGTFRWHWDQLHKDGLLRTDKATGALIITPLAIVDSEEF